MIRIRATINGESDAPPFTRVFDYDDEIFFSSAKMIEEKLQQGLKVNANEALMMYCAHAVKAIRAGRQNRDIQRSASKILSVSSVMIGVPETLQAIALEVTVGNRARKIILKEPIPKSGYMMAEH